MIAILLDTGRIIGMLAIAIVGAEMILGGTGGGKPR